MTRPRTISFALGCIFPLALLAQTLDPMGFFSRATAARHRLPTNNPTVTFEVDREGGAVFYSSVQPFRGIAITPDGRNVYLGN